MRLSNVLDSFYSQISPINGSAVGISTWMSFYVCIHSMHLIVWWSNSKNIVLHCLTEKSLLDHLVGTYSYKITIFHYNFKPLKIVHFSSSNKIASTDDRNQNNTIVTWGTTYHIIQFSFKLLLLVILKLQKYLFLLKTLCLEKLENHNVALIILQIQQMINFRSWISKYICIRVPGHWNFQKIISNFPKEDQILSSLHKIHNHPYIFELRG